jgi:hypothetical protein
MAMGAGDGRRRTRSPSDRTVHPRGHVVRSARGSRARSRREGRLRRPHAYTRDHIRPRSHLGDDANRQLHAAPDAILHVHPEVDPAAPSNDQRNAAAASNADRSQPGFTIKTCE